MAELPAPASTLSVQPWRVVATLCGRELTRFFRQRNRVVGALGQPLLFWLLFSAGLGPSFRMPGAADSSLSFGQYFFPGTVVLIVLFTSIFATISIIEDRREGFLQSVLVAPIPRWSMVLGKLLGGTLIAVIQAVLFLVLGWFVGVRCGPIELLHITSLLFVLSLALTGLGFVIAWRLDSTQGFHAIMSLFLMPMWLLSGAFFPATQGLLRVVQLLNPLSYGVAGLRQLLYSTEGGTPAGLADLPSLATCWLVTLLFAIVTFAISWRVSARRISGDLL